jgi:hypothetical protein
LAGVIATVVVVAFDNNLTLEQKIQQILLSILSAVMSSLIITYAASALLLTPQGLILFGVLASLILAMALSVIAIEYFSFNQRIRNEWEYA